MIKVFTILLNDIQITLLGILFLTTQLTSNDVIITILDNSKTDVKFLFWILNNFLTFTLYSLCVFSSTHLFKTWLIDVLYSIISDFTPSVINFDQTLIASLKHTGYMLVHLYTHTQFKCPLRHDPYFNDPNNWVSTINFGPLIYSSYFYICVYLFILRIPVWDVWDCNSLGGRLLLDRFHRTRKIPSKIFRLCSDCHQSFSRLVFVLKSVRCDSLVRFIFRSLSLR